MKSNNNKIAGCGANEPLRLLVKQSEKRFPSESLIFCLDLFWGRGWAVDCWVLTRALDLYLGCGEGRSPGWSMPKRRGGRQGGGGGGRGLGGSLRGFLSLAACPVPLLEGPQGERLPPHRGDGLPAGPGPGRFETIENKTEIKKRAGMEGSLI